MRPGRVDEVWIRDFAAAIYDRDYCPAGFRRQARALLAAPDLRPGLAQLTLPATVIHGRDDRLISYQGGIATAAAAPGAELHLYAGMGHQVAPRLWSEFVRVIARNMNGPRAAARRPPPPKRGPILRRATTVNDSPLRP